MFHSLDTSVVLITVFHKLETEWDSSNTEVLVFTLEAYRHLMMTKQKILNQEPNIAVFQEVGLVV
jgi:hypothetical protein